RLHCNLRRQAAPATPLLQVGDLSLDPLSRSVKRGPRPVALTAREYQLLLLLLERQGTVVSRELILRRVWNDDQGTSSNVIEVYVRYLRQKLEEGGERRLIHTVRGQGYCLSERLPPLGGKG
ncbi:MAG: winged helix-turn-helix domain-containing protein, partial [Cyanobium sp.]